MKLINGEKLIEWLRGEGLAYAKYGHDRAHSYWLTINEIESGTFDTDNHYFKLVTSATADNERLREALDKVGDELLDDTSPRAQRINRIIFEALSGASKPTDVEIERLMMYHGGWNDAKAHSQIESASESGVDRVKEWIKETRKIGRQDGGPAWEWQVDGAIHALKLLGIEIGKEETKDD